MRSFKAFRPSFWIACLVAGVPLAGCNREAVETVRRAALYASYTATEVPASAVFCGNQRKPSRGGRCASKAQGRAGIELPALERVEVRGWVIGAGSFADADNDQGVPEEFVFDLLLDHGWAPGAENVRPLNTVQEIDRATSPHNAIHFGRGAAGAGSAQLDGDGKVWGGRQALVVHVEVNGWFPDGMPRGTRMHGMPAPSDWVPVAATPGVLWPFDPQNPPAVDPGRPLQEGDYVRIVGTLWEDEPHRNEGGNGGPAGEDAKDCWCSDITGDCEEGSWGRGWFEIHPVDYMARIDEPPVRPDAVEMLAVCGRTTFVREVAPPGPRPSPQSVAAEEHGTGSGFNRRGCAVTFTPLGDRVRIEASSTSDEARCKRTYRVFWR